MAKALREAVKAGTGDREKLLALGRDVFNEVKREIGPETQEIIVKHLGSFDHYLEQCIENAVLKIKQEPLHVIQGVLQKCPSTLVLDLLRLRLHLGPGQPDVVDRIGPGQGDDGQDDALGSFDHYLEQCIENAVLKIKQADPYITLPGALVDCSRFRASAWMSAAFFLSASSKEVSVFLKK